ncbi:hypothetical protein STEG23_020860 [Scotinomys teguina]
MGLLRIMMPPKLQLLAVVAFAVAMLFLENQIQKLEESRAKLVPFICSFKLIRHIYFLNSTVFILSAMKPLLFLRVPRRIDFVCVSFGSVYDVHHVLPGAQRGQRRVSDAVVELA